MDPSYEYGCRSRYTGFLSPTLRVDTSQLVYVLAMGKRTNNIFHEKCFFQFLAKIEASLRNHNIKPIWKFHATGTCEVGFQAATRYVTAIYHWQQGNEVKKTYYLFSMEWEIAGFHICFYPPFIWGTCFLQLIVGLVKT